MCRYLNNKPCNKIQKIAKKGSRYIIITFRLLLQKSNKKDLINDKHFIFGFFGVIKTELNQARVLDCNYEQFAVMVMIMVTISRPCNVKAISLNIAYNLISNTVITLIQTSTSIVMRLHLIFILIDL